MSKPLVVALANLATDSLWTASGKMLPTSMSEAHFTSAAHLEGYRCRRSDLADAR